MSGSKKKTFVENKWTTKPDYKRSTTTLVGQARKHSEIPHAEPTCRYRRQRREPLWPNRVGGKFFNRGFRVMGKFQVEGGRTPGDKWI